MKIFSPQITGSLEVDGNSTLTGSLTVTGGITGSFSGTASFATNSITASFSQNSEIVTAGGGGSELFVTMVDSTGIDGKYGIRQSIPGDGALIYNDTAGGETLKTRFFQGALVGNADTATSASFASTASFTPNALVTASVSSNTITFSKGDGSTFPITVSTGSGGTAFPFTGSAVITGSLAVTGSVSATSALIMGLNSTNTNGINIANKGYTNTIGEFYDGIAIGRGNVLNFQGNGYGSFVIGRDNTIGAGNFTSFNTIIGNSNTISGNGSSRIIAGGANNIQTGSPTSTTSSFSAILGGNLNRIGDCFNAGVIVGTNNTASHNNSVVIGGSNISTAAANTVYVPSFNASGSAVITGSLVIANDVDTTVFSLTQAGISAYGISHGGGFDTTVTIPINATHVFTGGGSNLYRVDTPLRVNNTFTVSGSTTLTGSLNVLGASTYNGTSTFLQSTVFSGSIRGEVRPLSIASNTASLDCSSDNFYTLQLVAGTDTRIEPSNILPGQTINLRINTTGSATVSFPSSVLQSSGSAYVPTTTTGVDVVTFISFDSTSLLLSNVKNFI